ncbi:MAG TPA: LytTR family DNA-binding domain-containing protein, partial [Gemmatimonadales bacterium]
MATQPTIGATGSGGPRWIAIWLLAFALATPLAWSSVAFVYFGMLAAGRPLTFAHSMVAGLPEWYVWAGLTPSVPLIVFVTAFDEYTRAFDVHAADYLLKPFSDHRFRSTVAHVKERLRQRSAADLERLLAFVRELGELASSPEGWPAAPQVVPERIAIHTGNGVLMLALDDIEWVEARGDYVRVHSAGRVDLVRETISGIERRLPASRFVRIHRSTIVSIAKVKEIKLLPGSEPVAVLQSGVRCRLSRSGRDRLGRVV